MSYRVVDNPDESRYEVLDGEVRVGLVDYRRAPDSISLIHTETDPSVQGRGVASVLIEHVLREARAGGLAVLPYCPFVRRFIAERKEFLELVPEDRRSSFGLGA
jgi:predicted GNAT family acetyltransferase